MTFPPPLVTRYSLLVTQQVAQSTPSQQLLEKIVSLAKLRGFVFQSSEIYGGLNGCWDYGPLGVEMLRNLKDAWWRAMTQRGDIEGLDVAALGHRAPPGVLQIAQHFNAERTVIPAAIQAAINFGRLKYKPPPLGERYDLFE